MRRDLHTLPDDLPRPVDDGACAHLSGQTLLRRLAWIALDGVIETVFYPVFPPDESAATVLRHLGARSGS